MVVCNDCFAYIFGFFFGKTVGCVPFRLPACRLHRPWLTLLLAATVGYIQPLIRLSPKKTWEGFIGGFLATLVWSFWVSFAREL